MVGIATCGTADEGVETWVGTMPNRWEHGNMDEDMETQRHGDMETWRHGDMETRRHGN